MGNDTPLLNAALRYGQIGFPVFPCYWNGGESLCSCGKAGCSSPCKHPLTQHGFKDATVEPEIIRQWWHQWPRANVGLPTGAQLFVLDVDPHHGGDKTLEVLEAQHGRLPQTAKVRTGGGGWHIYVRLRAGVRVPNSQGSISRGLGPGLDIRGDGGYVIAPPSTHANGNIYQWAAGADIDDTPIADAPQWLLDLIIGKPTSKHRERCRSFSEHVGDAVHELAFALGLWKDGAGYRGPCPYHGGKSGNSFSLNYGYYGQPVFNCFKGCSQENLYDAVAIRGLAHLLPPRHLEIPASVIAVETAIASYSWRTRTGATDHDVLRAHLAIARRVRFDQYGASIREVCELAKIEKPNTVCIAQDRLIDAGWLIRLERGNWEHPARWQIKVGRGEGRNLVQSVPTTSVLGMYQSPSLSSEIFRGRRGALGKPAGRVYESIATCGRITIRELATRLEYHDLKSVRDLVRRLASYDLVTRMGTGPRGADLFGLGRRTPEQVAEQLGLADATEKQHARHDEDRRRFKLARAGVDARCMNDGSVVDTATGEVLADRNGHYPAYTTNEVAA